MATIYFNDGSSLKVSEAQSELVNIINTGVRMVQVTRKITVIWDENNCPDPAKFGKEQVDVVEAFNVDSIMMIHS